MKIRDILEERRPSCSWCHGSGTEWDPYAKYDGGDYRKCAGCAGTGYADYDPAIDGDDDED